MTWIFFGLPDFTFEELPSIYYLGVSGHCIEPGHISKEKPPWPFLSFHIRIRLLVMLCQNKSIEYLSN